MKLSLIIVLEGLVILLLPLPVTGAFWVVGLVLILFGLVAFTVMHREEHEGAGRG